MLLKEKYPITENEFDNNKNIGIDYNNLTIGTRKKVWWKCSKNSEHNWKVSVNQRTSSGKLRGCPFCAGKKVAESDSLKKTNPGIIKEWDYKLNKYLTPNNITYGSNKKVWWRCLNNKDHLWQASPKQRIKQNNSCPFCNSLELKFPQIAKEWHPTKNGNLTPRDVSNSSHRSVWWKCSKGFDHVWKSSINSRTAMKTGCPICSGYRVVKSNSLATMNPEIASQWHSEKNGKLQPENVFYKSFKKVWWKCPEGDDHEWEATIKSRVNGMGCPICSGRKVTKSNSLAIRYPEIARLWNNEKNGELSPYKVTPYSNKLVWWKCPEGDDHEWETSVANVVNGSNCPVCINRKITKSNNLFALYPSLKKEWNFNKNKNINPTEISAGSKMKVWWICKDNSEHIWYSSISDRTKKNSGCPYCSIKLNVSEIKMLNIIKSLFPNLKINYRTKPKWLGGMELDVYIPKIKLGFEYQGIQHFKPIEFFGGVDTYVAQVERDKRKKNICESLGIELIYVYYDEVLSQDLIWKKIINSGITSN